MNPVIQTQADTLRLDRTFFARKVSGTSQDAAVGARGPRPRVIAVASGKGGVGKTTLTANLAIAFARRGHRVLTIDGDLGLANLDLAFGLRPERTLLDLLEGSVPIEAVLATGPQGVALLPACSGRYDLANLADRERVSLFAAIDALERRYDTLLVDTAAGIGSNAVAFAGAAQQVVIATTPEPTALADAYAFIKVLWTRCRVTSVHLVANMVASEAEGEEVYRRMCDLADRFLGVGIDYLGAVVRDRALVRSVHAGVPLLIGEPRSPAARCIEAVATRLSAAPQTGAASGGIGLFWKRLLLREAAR
ncbi:MAG: MinD/ParA family protein [Deltaproteobacteria bacterium]|nr:MinD/ParA family protein [Deltaproteobacteria bacterium]